MKTLREAADLYRPAIALEKLLSRKTLSALRALFFSGLLLSIAASAVFTFTEPFYDLVRSAYGITLLFFALWLEQILIFSYHNSFFFRGLNSIIGLEPALVEIPTYDAAKVALSNPDDITAAFCTSSFGTTVLIRSGITPDIIATYISTPRTKLTTNGIVLPDGKVFTLIELGSYLLSHDPSFKEFLKSQGVLADTYFGALKWVISSYHQEKRALRFWSKDNLSKTTGIGRSWSYGRAYTLERFSRSIQTSAVFSTLTNNAPYAEEKVTEIETALSKAKTANVLIIGEAGVGKIDLVMEVARRIKNGKGLHAISGMQFYVLDTNRLFATHNDKQSLEETLLHLFDEAHYSGNITIIIENISTVMREAEGLGVYLPQLLDEYLSSSELHIIATDTPGGFHTYLEPQGGFVRRFTEILIDAPDTSATTRVLQSIAYQNEVRYNTVFTYNALEAIATSADRYIVEGVMPDKAIQLLVDVATQASRDGVGLIAADYIYEIISNKTGIPAGPVRDQERDLLLHLEEKLHSQVIGQERALDAVARTMRRARVGIQSSDKPIGSFLFLGPTGVGKTETAKALANIFFGGETTLQRIDMSEYSGPESLTRLIGTRDKSGVLPDMLKEHPYCVLLLDEFEKGNRTVHDLFLQILDEGTFTDGRGNKINARNTIVIATSNAGSALIMKTVEQRKELAQLTQEIISGIIRDGIFRPELINRFDSTIIFEPLTIGQQSNVASLMLNNLTQRVEERGYTLSIAPDLLQLLVQKGYSPEFGARPMQRVIQDVIEEKIAQKIIAGEVAKGDTITLTTADFSEKELAV
jgi:ATP-dependent Clp protease ATP-binding subunit ClpC